MTYQVLVLVKGSVNYHLQKSQEMANPTLFDLGVCYFAMI